VRAEGARVIGRGLRTDSSSIGSWKKSSHIVGLAEKVVVRNLKIFDELCLARCRVSVSHGAAAERWRLFTGRPIGRTIVYTVGEP
jgi:hypothetical protein